MMHGCSMRNSNPSSLIGQKAVGENVSRYIDLIPLEYGSFFAKRPQEQLPKIFQKSSRLAGKRNLARAVSSKKL